jgi:hypothetical protein
MWKTVRISFVEHHALLLTKIKKGVFAACAMNTPLSLAGKSRAAQGQI